MAVLFALVTALAITVAGALFLHQLRDDLNDTFDSGLRDRLADDISDLAIDGRLDTFGPSEEFTLVQKLDGTIVVATADARALSLSPQQRQMALTNDAAFTTAVAGHRYRIRVSTAPYGSTRVLVAVGTPTAIADDAIERVRAALLLMANRGDPGWNRRLAPSRGRVTPSGTHAPASSGDQRASPRPKTGCAVHR